MIKIEDLKQSAIDYINATVNDWAKFTPEEMKVLFVELIEYLFEKGEFDDAI